MARLSSFGEAIFKTPLSSISIDEEIPEEKDYLKLVNGFKKEIEKAYKIEEKASRYKELDIIR